MTFLFHFIFLLFLNYNSHFLDIFGGFLSLAVETCYLFFLCFSGLSSVNLRPENVNIF